MNKSRLAPAPFHLYFNPYPHSIMELHEYNAAVFKMIADSLMPRTIAQENEELHARTDPAIRNAMKEIMRIASYADDLSQGDILDGLRSVDDICERTLAQYPAAHEEDPA